MGTAEEAHLYLERGFYMGFTGYLCKDKSDTGVRKLLDDGKLPLERLLVETDSPFMYPNTRASKLPAHVKAGISERSMIFLQRLVLEQLELCETYANESFFIDLVLFLCLFTVTVRSSETSRAVCQLLLK